MRPAFSEAHLSLWRVDSVNHREEYVHTASRVSITLRLLEEGLPIRDKTPSKDIALTKTNDVFQRLTSKYDARKWHSHAQTETNPEAARFDC